MFILLMATTKYFEIKFKKYWREIWKKKKEKKDLKKK